jgi:hypothetical protein
VIVSSLQSVEKNIGRRPSDIILIAGVRTFKADSSQNRKYCQFRYERSVSRLACEGFRLHVMQCMCNVNKILYCAHYIKEHARITKVIIVNAFSLRSKSTYRSANSIVQKERNLPARRHENVYIVPRYFEDKS